jgi:hypothetical protein
VIAVIKEPNLQFPRELDYYFHVATEINKITTHRNQLTNKEEITTLATVGINNS